MCSVDPLCRTRFFITAGDTHDRDRFNYLFERYVQELGLDEAALNTTCPPSPSPLWLPLLRQAHFCTDNEFLEIGTGCVCRHDKVCHETPASTILFDTGGVVLLVLLLTGILIYGIVRVFSDLARLHPIVVHHHRPLDTATTTTVVAEGAAAGAGLRFTRGDGVVRHRHA